MNTRPLTLLLMSVALAACERNPEPAAVEPVVTAAQAPAAPVAANDALLIEGIKPTFAHKVRSSATEPTDDGGIKHRVNIEYIGLDAEQVGDALKRTFESSGFGVSGPVNDNGKQKYTAVGGENRKIGYVVAPAGPSLDLKLGPDSAGIVTFLWIEQPAR